MSGPSEPVERLPLFVVKGDATPLEVAALVTVLQGLAAGSVAPEPTPVSEWSAHRRKVRDAYHAHPGGWRASGLPR